MKHLVLGNVGCEQAANHGAEGHGQLHCSERLASLLGWIVVRHQALRTRDYQSEAEAVQSGEGAGLRKMRGHGHTHCAG